VSEDADKSKPAEAADDERRKSGRATFEADGRGVWEWQISTGVFSRTLTEDQLMELAQSNLELAEDPPQHANQNGWIYPGRTGWSSATPQASAPKSSKGRVQQGSVRRLLQRFVGTK
jgi:hypothetical protein